MPSITLALAPSEEHVAGGLHESITIHDPLAVVVEDARAGIRFQHRGAGFLDLKDKRITFPRHK